jgi:hypothetical protein
MKKTVLTILSIIISSALFIHINLGLASAQNQSPSSSVVANNTTYSQNQTTQTQSAPTQPGSIGQTGQSQSHSGQSQSQSGPAGIIGQSPSSQGSPQ